MLRNKKLISILVALMVISFSLDVMAQRKRRETRSTGPKKTTMDVKEVKSDKASMEKRDEAIKQLNDLIKDYPEGPRKAEVYRRLAELYWEKAKGIKDVIMKEFNKATDKYYEINDPNAPMPELDLKPSWVWNNKAVDICDYIIKKYPAFTGIDEVYFFMASNLMEIGQPLRAVRYYKLVVEKYISRWVNTFLTTITFLKRFLTTRL